MPAKIRSIFAIQLLLKNSIYMSQSHFQKFASRKKNSVVKEEFRQEKKKARAEKNAYFEKVKEEKYQAMLAKRAQKEGKPVKAAASTLSKSKAVVPAKPSATTSPMPLNKFLAHCGVCSRRDAVLLINEGKVKVNGTIATEPGYKVKPTDEVMFNNKKLFITKNL